ncbi:LemA family protein [Patescibacteria group bacterium]|nr:LemA family protein [Patescibacteria group bacterium]
MQILIVALVLIGVFLWLIYNSLISLKMKVSEALSQIDVQLKRRADLIPNLVETVKGYAAHENELFEKVTKERSALLSAKGAMEKASANNELSQTLKSIFAVAENYPDLKASQNFSQLQEELSDTENKIAYARQFYNSNVMNYNTKIKIFPNVIFARMLNFQPSEFFGATEGDKQPIQVKF